MDKSLMQNKKNCSITIFELIFTYSFGYECFCLLTTLKPKQQPKKDKNFRFILYWQST